MFATQTKYFVSIFLVLWLNIFGQTKNELQQLEDFAKLYGTVRYFHPSDEASMIHWKAFAVYGIDNVLHPKKDHSFNTTLQTIFSPVAPSLSFNDNMYQWNNKAKYPVYWVHYGLGIDSAYPNNQSLSYRYNKSKNVFSNKSANIFINYPIKWAKTLKLSYYAKSTFNGKCFGLLKTFDANNKVIQSVIGNNQPVTSNHWEYRELVIADCSNVNEILIALFANDADGSFKDVKLTFEQENNHWIDIKLPAFNETNAWGAEPKGDYLVKDTHTVSLKTIIESKQQQNLVIDSLTHPLHQIKLYNDTTVNIPTVVFANETRTLPVSNETTLTDLINKLNNINTEAFNKNTSLANAVVLWNAFRHFYPYQNNLSLNWNALLHNLLRNTYNAITKEEHLLALEVFLEHFKDGHIRVNQNEIIPNFENTYGTPLVFAFVDDKLVVKDYKNNFNGLIEKGTIITKINNTPIQALKDSLNQYISGSNQYKNVKLLRKINEGALNTQIKIKTKQNKELVLTRTLAVKDNNDFFNSNTSPKYKEITKDIFYVNLSKVTATDIDSLAPHLTKYKNLIVDNRNYPLDTRHRIFSYFSVIDTAKWLATTKITNPNYINTSQIYSSYKLNTQKQPLTLSTKNVLLVNENTISNGELFTQLLKHYQLATIIGKPTAGANGNINAINLLSGFQILFTGAEVINPNGSTFHSVGVLPDIEVNETLQDIQNNKDAYIEKAIQYFNTTY